MYHFLHITSGTAHITGIHDHHSIDSRLETFRDTKLYYLFILYLEVHFKQVFKKSKKVNKQQKVGVKIKLIFC